MLVLLLIFVVIWYHQFSIKILNPVVDQTTPIFLSPPEYKNDFNEEPMRLNVELESTEGNILSQYDGNVELDDIYGELSDDPDVEKGEKFYSLAVKCCESDNVTVLTQIFEHNQEWI